MAKKIDRLDIIEQKISVLESMICQQKAVFSFHCEEKKPTKFDRIDLIGLLVLIFMLGFSLGFLLGTVVF